MNGAEKLPENWTQVTLGDAAEYINGRAFKPKEWEKDGFPIIRIQNLNDHSAPFNYSTQEHKSKYKVSNGDLLFAWSASLGAHVWRGGDAWLNQHIFKVQPQEFVTKFYLYYLLERIVSELYDKTHGSGMVHITKKKFEETEIPLPPLPEQHRIVSKIEELFSELDNGVANLQKAQAQLKTYRQAVLKWAFEGKLTEASRKVYSNPDEGRGRAEVGNGKGAEALLEDIREERARRYAEEVAEWEEAVRVWTAAGKPGRKPAKPKRPKGFAPLTAGELEELPDLPGGWAWTRLGDVVMDVFDGPFGSNLKTKDYTSEGIRVIRLENLGFLEFLDDKKTFIGEDKYQQLQKHTLYKGDVLFSSFISDVIRTAVFPDIKEIAINKADCFVIRLDPNLVLSKFLVYVASARQSYNRLIVKTHGATRPRINTTQLKDLIIPLCTTLEQEAIVQEIESRLSVCDKLEENIAEALQKAEALRQSILRRAFEGKLVPQDPGEEPAGELLRRIKTLGDEGKQLKIKS